MALEDAAVLGNLFSRLKTQSQIPALLSAYEDIRQQRCSYLHVAERESADLLMLPSGPGQVMRDESLRMALVAYTKEHWDEADEENLRLCWGRFIPIFAYDANEACDDWWSKWGSSLDQRSTDSATNAFLAHGGIHLKIGVSSVSSCA
jgi:salicylate hydroxylase